MRYRIDLKQIRRMKIENHLSNKNMGNALCVSREQYGKKESGIAPFKADEIGILSDLFNCDPGFFYTPDVSDTLTKSL